VTRPQSSLIEGLIDGCTLQACPLRKWLAPG